ncbi:hypothetical protein HBI70_042960 [Parastagonospora nodorum]|nr:hypothetical protein HBH97_009500 [Parastagonospora nodorum]KAH4420335.1 hypothetical protein HBH92_032930 [Parastagonospora nodorum]KAH4452558.1 hypothetical protein HBH93_030420 [Parastagonospora nodorum]KAH4465319.1 hypothetical protein HBH91_032950 [Parastagonospora nodorum]KAH4517210.1 hypothetical protein HBH89_009730 [Parastagonospora nodorum]
MRAGQSQLVLPRRDLWTSLMHAHPFRPPEIIKMAGANEKPFRFMDFPEELRNKVYAILLCSFAEPTVVAVSKS